MKVREYSEDLRLKTISMVAEGFTLRAIQKILKISQPTIVAWKRLYATTGSVKALPRNYSRHLTKILDKKLFCNFIAANQGKSVAELANIWGGVSPTTIRRTLKRFGYTYKKNRKDTAKQVWLQEQNTKK